MNLFGILEVKERNLEKNYLQMKKDYLEEHRLEHFKNITRLPYQGSRQELRAYCKTHSMRRSIGAK